MAGRRSTQFRLRQLMTDLYLCAKGDDIALVELSEAEDSNTIWTFESTNPMDKVSCLGQQD